MKNYLLHKLFAILILSLAIFIALIWSSAVSHAQVPTQVIHSKETWTQFTFTGRISKHWSLYLDFVDRFNEFGTSENTLFIRPAVLFHINKKVSLGAGYCYAVIYPGSSLFETTDEQRPWQQVQVSHTLRKFSVQHRFRLEERFNHPVYNGQAEHGYKETFRFRYKLNVQYALFTFNKKKNTAGIVMSEEFFTNYGNNASSWFNQNRFFVGAGIEFNKNISLAAGVTDIYRTTSVKGVYNNVIAPTLNVNVKLRL